jgi:hypothetical protein
MTFFVQWFLTTPQIRFPPEKSGFAWICSIWLLMFPIENPLLGEFVEKDFPIKMPFPHHGYIPITIRHNYPWLTHFFDPWLTNGYPGSHFQVDIQLPYYFQVLGLGAAPTETVVSPGLRGIGLEVGRQPGAVTTRESPTEGIQWGHIPRYWLGEYPSFSMPLSSSFRASGYQAFDP